MLEQCLSSARASCLEQCVGSNARTYVRTDKELLTLGSYLALGIARRGAARFPLKVDAAGAARGRTAAR